MLHLVRCRNTSRYWNAVCDFLEGVLGIKDTKIKRDRLIIFNTIANKMISEEARAFVRHAFHHFYRDFAMVDTHDKPFIWQRTFDRTMQGFKRAVLAYAQTIKTFHANRLNTGLPSSPPEETLKRFTKLVSFESRGASFQLADKLVSATENAAKAVADLANDHRNRT
jgi:hypothetical protein